MLEMKMRYLLAEWDKVIRRLLTDIFKEMGDEVIEVVAPEETILLYDKEKPDIVILDGYRDKIKDVEACRHIREMGSESGGQPYIIIIVEMIQDDFFFKALEADVDDFLTKPLSYDSVVKRMKVAKTTMSTLESIKKPKYDLVGTLKEEHELIARFLNILENISAQLSRGIPEEVLTWASETAVLLDLEIHHEKEEKYIAAFIRKLTDVHSDWFGAVAESDFSRVNEEHEEMKSLLMYFRGLIHDYITDVSKADELREVIDKYTILIKDHITREDDVFFPFSKKYLDDADLVQLADEFEGITDKVGKERIQKRMVEMNRILAALKSNAK